MQGAVQKNLSLLHVFAIWGLCWCICLFFSSLKEVDTSAILNPGDDPYIAPIS